MKKVSFSVAGVLVTSIPFVIDFVVMVIPFILDIPLYFWSFWSYLREKGKSSDEKLFSKKGNQAERKK